MARIKLYEIREWLETLGVAENFYSGRFDGQSEKSIFVADKTDNTPSFIAMGGHEHTKSHARKVAVYLHWNDNPRETEDAADVFIGAIKENQTGGFYIGEHLIDYIDILTDGMVDIGEDENGIFEYVVWLKIYYSE